MIIWLFLTIITPIVLGRSPIYRGCPLQRPKSLNSICFTKGLKCSYGKQCCCGKCYSSRVYLCPGVGKPWAIRIDDTCAFIKCPCNCPKYGIPVCGSDGKNYANKCLSKCAGNFGGCEGKCPCKKKCTCPKLLNPVCGKDGKTHWNSCLAGCKGTTVKCRGKCPCRPRYCLAIWRPVCGINGITYSNSCRAKSKGVKVACKRQCPCRVCRCRRIFRPVCGRNGKLYRNKCEANCKGVAILGYARYTRRRRYYCRFRG